MEVRSYYKVAVAVAVLTIAMKTVAWWISGSVGLLSDAMESLVNLAGAVFGLMMVTVAALPPDASHPFGHHKAEYFSSGFEGMMIFVASLAILWTAGRRLLAPQPLEAMGWGLALSVGSSALNGALAAAMLRKARRAASLALEASARHLITDVWTSAGIVVGLLGVLATGWVRLDPLIAMAVALNILREGGMLVWRSAAGLMDASLEPDVRERIDRTLEGLRVPGVHFDHVVTRRAGQRHFVDLHMHMPGGWTLQRAAAQRGAVESGLMQALPGVWPTIQMLPTDVEPQLEAEDPQ